MRLVSPPLSLAWDPDVILARVLDLFAHPGPLVEGRTACDVKEHQAPPVTLSTGVGVHDAMQCHPSPLSMSSEELDTMVSPSAVHHHHHHSTPHLMLHSIKVCSFVDRGQCMANTQPSHHPYLLSLVPPHLRMGTGTMWVEMGRLISQMPDPSPTFTAMMDFIYETFPEAHGSAPEDSAPLLGMQRGEVPAPTPSLR